MKILAVSRIEYMKYLKANRVFMSFLVDKFNPSRSHGSCRREGRSKGDW